MTGYVEWGREVTEQESRGDFYEEHCHLWPTLVTFCTLLSFPRMSFYGPRPKDSLESYNHRILWAGRDL